MSDPRDSPDAHESGGSSSSVIRSVMIRLLVTISLLELSIMLLFSAIALKINPVAESLLDAGLLSFAAAPVIYLWIVRPFVRSRDAAEQRVRHLALHDPLTQLANRRQLETFARHTLLLSRRSLRCAALLLVDLDGFKPVNDRHGHHAGDLVLRTIADRLNASMRGTDLCARLGGDEFAVVLADLGDSEAEARERALNVATELRKVIAQDIAFGAEVLHIDSSIGVRLIDGSVDTVEALLREADSAMYAAKRGGRAQARVFEPTS